MSFHRFSGSRNTFLCLKSLFYNYIVLNSTVLYCKVQYDNETVDYSHVICLFVGFGVKESNSASKTTIL